MNHLFRGFAKPFLNSDMKPTIPAKNKASRDMINQATEKFAEEPIKAN